MLNFNVNHYKKLVSQNDSVVLAQKVLAEQIGEINFSWIEGSGILKEVLKEELGHIAVELQYSEQGEREEFSVYWENDEYILEPSADHLPIMKKKQLYERIFRVTNLDFVKAMALANGFSYRVPSFPLHEGFFFVGSRKFGNRPVSLLLFLGDPELDLERISAQIKLAQNFDSSCSYIVSVFSKGTLAEFSQELSFALNKVRSNLLISPSVYKKLGIPSKDVIGQIRFPVLIDKERALLFILGKQITKQAGTILYRYLRDFLLQTQHNPVAYDLFCSEFCQDQNGEPSRIIGERKKEAIVALKSVFNETSSEYLFAYNGFFSYQKGFLQSHFRDDDIFEW